jgi:hypothetical protein
VVRNGSETEWAWLPDLHDIAMIAGFVAELSSVVKSSNVRSLDRNISTTNEIMSGA